MCLFYMQGRMREEGKLSESSSFMYRLQYSWKHSMPFQLYMPCPHDFLIRQL
jgi:hypothetical protein